MTPLETGESPEEAFTTWRMWREENADAGRVNVPLDKGIAFLEDRGFSELWGCKHASGKAIEKSMGVTRRVWTETLPSANPSMTEEETKKTTEPIPKDWKPEGKPWCSQDAATAVRNRKGLPEPLKGAKPKVKAEGVVVLKPKTKASEAEVPGRKGKVPEPVIPMPAAPAPAVVKPEAPRPTGQSKAPVPVTPRITAPRPTTQKGEVTTVSSPSVNSQDGGAPLDSKESSSRSDWADEVDEDVHSADLELKELISKFGARGLLDKVKKADSYVTMSQYTKQQATFGETESQMQRLWSQSTDCRLDNFAGAVIAPWTVQLPNTIGVLRRNRASTVDLTEKLIVTPHVARVTAVCKKRNGKAVWSASITLNIMKDGKKAMSLSGDDIVKLENLWKALVMWAHDAWRGTVLDLDLFSICWHQLTIVRGQADKCRNMYQWLGHQYNWAVSNGALLESYSRAWDDAVNEHLRESGSSVVLDCVNWSEAMEKMVSWLRNKWFAVPPKPEMPLKNLFMVQYYHRDEWEDMLVMTGALALWNMRGKFPDVESSVQLGHIHDMVFDMSKWVEANRGEREKRREKAAAAKKGKEAAANKTQQKKS